VHYISNEMPEPRQKNEMLSASVQALQKEVGDIKSRLLKLDL